MSRFRLEKSQCTLNCAIEPKASVVDSCFELLPPRSPVGGAQWQRRDGWASDRSYCTWAGVTCHNHSVVALDLSNNYHSQAARCLSSGRRSPSWGAEPFLEPDERPHQRQPGAQKLRDLNIYDNQFSGTVRRPSMGRALPRDGIVTVPPQRGPSCHCCDAVCTDPVGTRADERPSRVSCRPQPARRLDPLRDCVGSLPKLAIEALHLFNNQLDGSLA